MNHTIVKIGYTASVNGRIGNGSGIIEIVQIQRESIGVNGISVGPDGMIEGTMETTICDNLKIKKYHLV